MPSSIATSAFSWVAAFASASGVGAPSTKSSVGDTRRRKALVPSPTYSSTAMWKFDPPKPKELMPARRGWSSGRTQGRARVLRWKGLSASSSFGLG